MYFVILEIFILFVFYKNYYYKLFYNVLGIIDIIWLLFVCECKCRCVFEVYS